MPQADMLGERMQAVCPAAQAGHALLCSNQLVTCWAAACDCPCNVPLNKGGSSSIWRHGVLDRHECNLQTCTGDDAAMQYVH